MTEQRMPPPRQTLNIAAHVERRSRVAFSAIVGIYLLGAIAYALPWLGHVDFGYYVSANWNTHLGKLPYRDFMFPQAPLMAYVFAPAQLAGFDAAIWLDVAMNILFGLGALILTMRLGVRVGGPLAGILAGLFLVGIVMFETEAGSGSPVPVLAFLVALTLTCLGTATMSNGRYAMAGITAGLAVGMRISFVGLVMLVVLAPFFLSRGRARWSGTLWAFAGSAVTLIAVFLPFAIIAPRETWFGLVQFHVWNGNDPSFSLAQRVKYKIDGVARWIGYSPLVWGVAASGAVAIFSTWRSHVSKPQFRGILFVIGAVPIFVLGPLFAKTFLQPYWFLFAMPAVCVTAGVLVSRWLDSTGGNVRGTMALLIVGILAAQTVAAVPPAVHKPTPAGSLPLQREMASALRAKLGPMDEVLTFLPAVAYLAGARIVPGTEMIDIAFYPSLSLAEAKRLNVMSFDRVEHVLSTERPRALLVRPVDFTYTEAPSTRLSTADQAARTSEVWTMISANYTREETWGEGDLAPQLWIRNDDV